jgi:hypothetical protein
MLRGDPEAIFKSDTQRKLVESVMVYMIGVLPTRGGKSLAYKIPPICTGQVTIIMCPFRILVSQVIQKCREHGLAVVHWGKKDAKDLNKDVRLIIITIEPLLIPTCWGEWMLFHQMQSNIIASDGLKRIT